MIPYIVARQERRVLVATRERPNLRNDNSTLVGKVVDLDEKKVFPAELAVDSYLARGYWDLPEGLTPAERHEVLRLVRKG